jgi:hypothetical protein
VKKKTQESLSPEQKGQVMTIYVAAHTKQYELLPLEKKARLIETRTEQRHEHLTEEEKEISAQIRSVAVTLYKTVYLDKSTVEFVREHFYKDPILALANFIVVQQILVWQYSMMNYNQMLMDQSYGIAFETLSGVPLGKKKQCFVKRHSTTLTNHMQELLPVHLVVNSF